MNYARNEVAEEHWGQCNFCNCFGEMWHTKKKYGEIVALKMCIFFLYFSSARRNTMERQGKWERSWKFFVPLLFVI